MQECWKWELNSQFQDLSYLNQFGKQLRSDFTKGRAYGKRNLARKDNSCSLKVLFLASSFISCLLFVMPISTQPRLGKTRRDFYRDQESYEEFAFFRRTIVCSIKEYRGLNIWNLLILNKASLGKWTLRFAMGRNKLWQKGIWGSMGIKMGVWCSMVGRVNTLKSFQSYLNAKGFFILGTRLWNNIWCEDFTFTIVSKLFCHL